MIEIQNVTPGTVLPMLNGVVRVVDVEWDGGPIVTVGVSIGKLVDHKTTWKAGQMVEPVSMPDNLAGWYGV